MATNDSPVTEDELHAYVDGELPPDRVEAVSTWLSGHPDQAALVAVGARRPRPSARATRALPANRCRSGSKSRRWCAPAVIGRRWIAVAIAASLAAFLIGGGTGWIAHGAAIGVRRF